MTTYTIQFANGSVFATDPSSEPECQLNGGLWDTGAFKHLKDMEGIVVNNLVLQNRRYKEISLTIPDMLTVDCNASSFLENQTQVQIYRGDFNLYYSLRLTLWQRIRRWFSSLFGLNVGTLEGNISIPEATVTLSYPPVESAVVSGKMDGVMNEPLIPRTSTSVHFTFTTEGPSRPGLKKFIFPISEIVLRI